MKPIYEKTHGAKVIKIFQDDSPESPRTWDNLGKILYAKRSRYLLGDEAVEGETMQEIADNPDNIVLPVYAYIHSSVMLNTTGFSCPWDSGQSGIIYVNKEKVLKEFSVTEITPEIEQRVLEVFKSEIETFSRYLNGEVYGFQVEENGEVTDSCWGFYEEPEKLVDLVLKGAV